MSEDTSFFATVAFGSCFDIERQPDGSYLPAVWSSPGAGRRRKMYADARLLGFAEVIATGIAPHLALIGGDELRYLHEDPPVNEAVEIRTMLLRKFGLDQQCVSAHPSRSNTLGNVGVAHEYMVEHGLCARDAVWVTSHTHAVRVKTSLEVYGTRLEREGQPNVLAGIPVISAEGVYLDGAITDSEREQRRERLVELLDGGPLGASIADESSGVVRLLRGSYTPHTDVDPS